MKNLIILFLFFFSLKSFAQTFPIIQWQGAPGTNSQTKGTQSALTGFTWTTDYVDTLTANSVSYVKYTPGIVIRTGSIFWVRNNTANKWIQIGSVTAALNGTYIDGTTLKLGTNPLIETTNIPMGGFQLNFVGTRTTSVLPSGNIQMGNAGRISSNGTDTIKITQAASDVNGAAIATRKLVFYDNTLPSEISTSYIYAPQGDFLTFHAASQVNFEVPFITSASQNTSWLVGAKAPLVFTGSGNSTMPDLIEVFNSDTSNLNNQGGIGFSLNRTAFVKMKIARIAGIITDTLFHSPDGDLAFYTTKDSVLAEAFRIKGSKQIQALGYGAGTITGTPTKNLAVDASGNLIEVAVSGGGTLTAANNGLSLSSTTVQLGGSNLTQYSSIALNGFPLTINHNGVSNAAQSDSNMLRFTNNTLAVSLTDSLVSTGWEMLTASRKNGGGSGSKPILFRSDAMGLGAGAFANGMGVYRIRSNFNNTGWNEMFSISPNSNLALTGYTGGNITSTLAINGALIGSDNVANLYWGIGQSNKMFLRTALGSANIAIGSGALDSNTVGTDNVAIGFGALSKNDTANNIGIGGSSLNQNTKGYFNTAVGYRSMNVNTTGNQNAAFGMNALLAATTATKNTAIGTGVMEATTTGGFNTGVGHDALLQNTTGTDNIGIGWLGWSQNRTGTYNVGIGNSTGRNIHNGQRNVFIGAEAGYLDTSSNNSQKDTVNNSIAIGSQSFTTANNQIWIGNGSNNDLRLEGIVVGTAPKVLTYDPTTKKVTFIDTSLVGHGGGGGTTNHAALTNLSWTSSAHIGAASNLAGFNGANAASLYTLTGTGTVVAMQTSPVFTTPLLGTPTSGVLTNTTGYLWNNLTDPTADQALTFGAGFSSTWTNSNTTEDLLTINTSTLTTASLFSLNSTSTALAAGNNLAEFIMSGANGTVAITSTAIRAQVTNTNGTSGTNKAAQFNASGATTANWALYTGTATGADGRIAVNNPTDVANQVMVIKSLTNTAADGIIIKSNDESTSSLNIGSQTITASAAMILASSSSGVQISSRLYVGTSGTSPTAIVHIKAGTTAASSAPLKLTSGTSMTAAEAGAVEFTTDDLFFTITTGTARKRLLMADPVGGLTAGRVPFPATTNRLTDDASFTYGVTSGLGVSTTSTGTILSIGGAITPSAGSPGFITQLGGSITEAGTLTHSILAGVAILAPTVTGGAASVTSAASLYISGTPNASGATNSAIWAVGTLRLGQNTIVGGAINIEGLTSGTVSLVVPAIAGTTTLTLPSITGTMVQYSEAAITSSTTPLPTGNARENYLDITALAVDPTFAAPSGTLVNHNAITIRIKDSGVARTLSWASIYRGGVNIALPSTTTPNLTMYIQFIYNQTDNKFDIVGLSDGY